MRAKLNRVGGVLLLLAVFLTLASCGGNAAPPSSEARPSESGNEVLTREEENTAGEEAPETGKPAETPETGEPAETAEISPDTADPGKNVLVVYFSATGTTKDIAEKIALIEDADLYEIRAAEEYTDEDLDWHDAKSRTTLEQNDKSARPGIGSDPVELAGYERIYLGFPIWWGEEPRILDTFAESHDFSGITVIPFCTSSSSGIGRSGLNLQENAGSGTWLEGKRFGAGTSEDELREWIGSLN